ncbi:MAG: Rieske 2Fe-2S domain-containing protein [Methylococcaceae bacterium]|nr:Rieske 2Fe-2S domain-containing protein [Methylococcaceae bacterium]
MKLICALDDLNEVDCLEFVLFEKNTETKGFVVKVRNRIVAYKNQCPHAGVPLNWQENKFLDLVGSYIQCTLHGALFQIENGRCIWGPCKGQSLKPIATWVENNRLYHCETE